MEPTAATENSLRPRDVEPLARHQGGEGREDVPGRCDGETVATRDTAESSYQSLRLLRVGTLILRTFTAPKPAT